MGQLNQLYADFQAQEIATNDLRNQLMIDK